MKTDGKIVMLRMVVAAIIAMALSACRISVEVPEGGYLVSASGNYDCIDPDGAPLPAAAPNGRDRHLHRPGEVSTQHDENFHCEIDVSDTSFNETLTAVAYDGWQFSHWRSAEGSLYGGTSANPIQLWTLGFDAFPVLMDVLASNTTYYLEPIFKRVSADGNDLACDDFSGSFERIQSIVFDGYNCTNSACHGGSANAGGLDLSPAVAYDNLFRVDSTANLAEPRQRVYPGEQKLSFLYQKLEAGTLGTALPTGGGQVMPIGGSALSADHLEALRLWIRGGAPEFQDVDNVATLLGCSQPTPSQANKIEPPAAPPLGEGVQFVSGPWTVEADSENEVCYATYYDLEQTPGLLPDWAKTECEGSIYADYDGTCMAINSQILTQDPQSHHSIIDVYVGTATPLDESWGEWQCLNGPSAGAACDPTKIGVPVSQGGADCGGDLYVCGTPAQKSTACIGWGPRDNRFKQVSMGGSQAPISVNKLREGIYSVLPTKGVIAWNSHAFNLSDQETTVEQYNNFTFAPADAREHRNRAIFDSRWIFTANVPVFEQRTYCSTYVIPQGARLTSLSSHAHQRGVHWQTWLPPNDPACRPNTGCEPNERPEDYVSRIYNDPLEIEYDPPLEFDSADITQRTFKYCSTYDNGFNFPDLLKRNSTSVGSTCIGNAYCVGGSTPGLACGSDDSLCGDGGSCDACPVVGGVTTEDEMFILLGNYYLLPVN